MNCDRLAIRPARRDMNAAGPSAATGRDEAIAIESDDARISYREPRDAVARAASAWRALGLAPTTASWFAPDSIDCDRVSRCDLGRGSPSGSTRACSSATHLDPA
jgi:hypothetical protein